mmetsp:Transcript_7744/g.25794  ORF Transcript_7744/g.25794 Transcript_7744/m.25794 type:complete len:266 (+) Transcript_7744:563-1360(+)
MGVEVTTGTTTGGGDGCGEIVTMSSPCAQNAATAPSEPFSLKRFSNFVEVPSLSPVMTSTFVGLSIVTEMSLWLNPGTARAKVLAFLFPSPPSSPSRVSSRPPSPTWTRSENGFVFGTTTRNTPSMHDAVMCPTSTSFPSGRERLANTCLCFADLINTRSRGACWDSPWTAVIEMSPAPTPGTRAVMRKPPSVSTTSGWKTKEAFGFLSHVAEQAATWWSWGVSAANACGARRWRFAGPCGSRTPWRASKTSKGEANMRSVVVVV